MVESFLLYKNKLNCIYTIMNDGRSPRIRPVPAVTRAAAVLRLLARSRAPLRLAAIADALDLVPSTAMHTLRALVAERFVRVDPRTKQYRLGAGLLPLARAVLESDDFPSLARPRLDELSRQYGITAIGVEVPVLEYMIVVALSRAQTPVSLQVEIGSRFPALISATGRCVAAFTDRPWDEVVERFRGLIWHRAPSLEDWRGEIEEARRERFSLDRGNYIAGVTIAAVPVLDAAGFITHSIACVGLGDRFDPATRDALADDMRAAAADLGAELAAAV
jgi:DNA-binding IclR family transcriptional regulator